MARDLEGRIQHLCTVVVESEKAEQALEMEEVDLKSWAIRRRIIGKQTPDPHPLRDAVAKVSDDAGAPSGPARVPRWGGLWQPGEDVNALEDSARPMASEIADLDLER